MPLDLMLLPRFSISRFAHFLAIEARDLVGLNASTPRAVLRSSRYYAKGTQLANGTIVVLNGWWHHPPELFHRISAVLPPGPVALLYGDDNSWRASQIRPMHEAFLRTRPLVRHFAMNMAADALALVPQARQVPIGLPKASAALPRLLARSPNLPPEQRSSQLLCCCARNWSQRVMAFEALRAAGHAHCNLAERRWPFERMFADYQRHRFVVSVHGHGRTDFREWEILAAGAIPVVSYFPEHDSLLKGLPVVRVTDWSLVTPSFLDEQWRQIRRRAAHGLLSATKAHFPYWFAQMTAHMSPPRTVA